MSVERLVKCRGRKLKYRKEGDKIAVYSWFSWWAIRYADLVERRVVTDREWGHSTVRYEPRPRAPAPNQWMGKPPERPLMQPRPEGMTRQTQRRLYRQACKQLGVPYRAVT